MVVSLTEGNGCMKQLREDNDPKLIKCTMTDFVGTMQFLDRRCVCNSHSLS